MVYMSNNTSAFYKSESALKDLHLLPPGFPAQTSQPNSMKVAEKKKLCAHAFVERPVHQSLEPSRSIQ